MLRSAFRQLSRTPVAARSSRAAASQHLAALRSFHASAPSRKEDEDVGVGIIDKYQLYEPSRYVPIGAGLFSFLSLTGLYHWNEESQLLGLFLLFTGTIYAKGGDAIGKMLDEVGDQILSEHNALESQLVDALRASKALQEEGLKNYDDVIALYEDYGALVEKLGEVQPLVTKQQVHQQIERMMQIYVAQENKLRSNTETLVVDSAAEAVRAAFETNADLQASAMEAAFQTLGDLDAQSKDVVGELFTDFFTQFRKAAWEDRAANATVPVSAKLQEDTEAVRKQLVGALDGVEGAEKLFAPVGDKYDLVNDGLEGVVYTSDISSDSRFLSAAEENKRFMSDGDFKAWEEASKKLSAKEI